MTEKWVQGEVVSVKHWTDSLYSIKIDAPNVRFTAGQYTKISLNIDDEDVARPYSFVNSPDESLLEIYSVSVPNGPLSTSLKKLNKGDPIKVGTHGNGFLVLDEIPIVENIWMLATGTGLGVFISLLKTSDPWQRFENIVLVHGVRNSNELIYQDQINEFDKMNPGKFKYVKTVTREEKEGCLNMRIPAGLDSKMIQESANLEINQDSQIMICGNPDMINDTVELLGKQGLERNRRSKPGNITLEKYW